MFLVICVVIFFFFKQKTAYELRISDLSSDVCSSDLVRLAAKGGLASGRTRPDLVNCPARGRPGCRATPPIGAGMAWNIPGKNDDGGSGKDRRNPWEPRRGNGGGLGGLFDNFRGMFDGGGGSPLRWVGLALVLWLAFNCFVLVAEQERGVVLRFGQFARILEPGPHFKLPWPVERVTKVAATQIKTFSDNVPLLTADENIVQVEINVQYNVGDAQKYLFGTRDADEMLQQAALSAGREQVGRSNLDTVLGAREALAVSARKMLQASLDDYRTGLMVTELNVPTDRPPEAVKPAFDDVNSAQQDKDRLISEAEAYAAKIVPEAPGQRTDEHPPDLQSLMSNSYCHPLSRHYGLPCLRAWPPRSAPARRWRCRRGRCCRPRSRRTEPA